VLINSSASLVHFVVLIIKEEIVLVVLIEHPALMRVGSTIVRGDRDDCCVLLVGDVVDGQGVFVVPIANFSPLVLFVRPMIDETLRVMDVTILGSAAGLGRVGNVGQVDEDEAGSAACVTRIGANRDNMVGSGSAHNVMGATERKFVKVINVRLGVEFFGLCRKRVPPRANLKELDGERTER
jgi:hypothetical protein